MTLRSLLPLLGIIIIPSSCEIFPQSHFPLPLRGLLSTAKDPVGAASRAPTLRMRGGSLIETESSGHHQSSSVRLELCKGDLCYDSHRLLAGVGQGVEIEQGLNGVFLRAKSRLGVDFKPWEKREIGLLPAGTRAVACARQKLWWMGPSIGCCDDRDVVPEETQFLLLSLGDSASRTQETYALFLPMVSGVCRSSLDGALGGGRISITTETGCDKVLPMGNEDLVFVSVGTDPFKLLKNGFAELSERMGTFRVRETKSLPAHLDSFGWCTWDAFYHQVSGWGIERGLRELAAGGAPVKLLIIDDGWQDTASSAELEAPACPHTNNAFMSWTFKAATSCVDKVDTFLSSMAKKMYYEQVENAPRDSFVLVLWRLLAATVFKRALRICSLPNVAWGKRLVSTGASARFKSTLRSGETLECFIKRLKRDLGVQHVYAWHSLLGYWSGVAGQLAQELGEGGSWLGKPILSKGMIQVEPTLQWWIFVTQGVGLGGAGGGAAKALYEKMHKELAKSGVDGVKVDSQAAVVTLGGGRGGSVAFTRAYITALEESVASRFGDASNCVSCMCHPTECIYSYKTTSVIRASDDFWPKNTASHTVHAVNVAYNSLFLGEIAMPDWDMFQSRNEAASLHASLRAVGGCGVYVSDHPGEHNFEILSRLVLPCGTTLRARLPGRPTRDCLFSDVGMDGKSVLKIWNTNRCGGVIGAFNVQGSNWRRDKRMFWVWDWSPKPLQAVLKPRDVEDVLIHDGNPWTEYAILTNHFAANGSLKSSSFRLVTIDDGVLVKLASKESAIATISKVTKTIGGSLAWAPLGLSDMYNSGGSVLSCAVTGDDGHERCKVEIQALGPGRFAAYSSLKPTSCTIDSDSVSVDWEVDSGLVTLYIPSSPHKVDCQRSIVLHF